MKPLMVGLCSLALWAADVQGVRAAWNNVFQPTSFGGCCPGGSSNYQPSVAYSAPAASPGCCAPQQQCSTSYVPRCYYQPVTTYESRSYYEQVTTYQTSYYCEPVCSYRYSCYYDPCTCSYQQVATPVTSYAMRAQCCPVQSWVQRCCQVPVTTYQKACYWQPQTTCCQTTVGAPVPACSSGCATGCATAGPAPAVATAPYAPPSVSLNPPVGSPPPAASPAQDYVPQNGNGGYDRYYPPESRQQPMGIPNARKVAPAIAPPPPPVKLDRIAIGPDSAVEGTVVRSDNTPRPNARVVFVNSQQPSARQTVTANSAGRFHVSLASGSWNVYLYGADGNPAYHSRLEVGDNQASRITLVNR